MTTIREDVEQFNADQLEAMARHMAKTLAQFQPEVTTEAPWCVFCGRTPDEVDVLLPAGICDICVDEARRQIDDVRICRYEEDPCKD
jgi:hypothetical protein